MVPKQVSYRFPGIDYCIVSIQRGKVPIPTHPSRQVLSFGFCVDFVDNNYDARSSAPTFYHRRKLKLKTRQIQFWIIASVIAVTQVTIKSAGNSILKLYWASFPTLGLQWYCRYFLRNYYKTNLKFDLTIRFAVFQNPFFKKCGIQSPFYNVLLR